MLARREHSRLELVSKLQQCDFSASTINETIGQLVESNQQSDQRYAESYVYTRYQKGYGPYYISQQLQRQQIASQLINTLLNQHDWSPLATTVRVKKFGTTLPTDLKQRFKQMRFLQYRGFNQQQIEAALKHY